MHPNGGVREPVAAGKVEVEVRATGTHPTDVEGQCSARCAAGHLEVGVDRDHTARAGGDGPQLTRERVRTARRDEPVGRRVGGIDHLDAYAAVDPRPGEQEGPIGSGAVERGAPRGRIERLDDAQVR